MKMLKPTRWFWLQENEENLPFVLFCIKKETKLKWCGFDENWEACVCVIYSARKIIEKSLNIGVIMIMICLMIKVYAYDVFTHKQVLTKRIFYFGN